MERSRANLIVRLENDELFFPIPKPYSLNTLRVFLSSCAGGGGGGGVPGLLFVIHISGGVKKKP